MKNRIKYLVLASIASVSVYAQSGKVKDADKKYNDYDYVDAIKTYEKVFEKGYKSPEMLQKLGNSYYFKADLDNAAKWYGELFALPQAPPTEYYYRYAQSLKAVKDYKKADEIMAQFIEKNKADLRAVYAEGQKNYLDIIKLNSGRYEIENAGINSEKSDYGSAFLENKVIFASARDTFGVGNRKHDWTGESFTNLYSADMGEGGTLSSAEKFGNKLNSKFHESTPVFTKDGKTVYFTRDNYNGKRKYDSKKTTLLKVYKATLAGDTWTNIKELPFNSDQYSVAHPALSPDEKTLYFASDMPGTLGQSDLFKVAITGDDSYGTPENLGKTINTEGRETFPFITPQNEIYFASDGHPGLGGLDIFYSEMQNDGSFKEVLNVGEPMNSSKDDFAFLKDAHSNVGYITSNREGGMGGDDIYRFLEKEKIKHPCEQELSGVVTDEITGEPLGGAKVTLSDENFKYIRETIADKDGKYDFGKVDCGSKYNVKAEKTGYEPVESSVVTANKSGKTTLPIAPYKSGKDNELTKELILQKHLE
jgi:tetratricopeptide (TPR) repeat protein